MSCHPRKAQFRNATRSPSTRIARACATRPRRVLEGDVFGREVVGVDDGGGSAERTDGQAVLARHRGMQIVGHDRALPVLAHDGQESLLPLDVDELAIGAGLDADDPRLLARRGGRGGDGGLQGRVPTRAVGRHRRVRAKRRGHAARALPAEAMISASSAAGRGAAVPRPPRSRARSRRRGGGCRAGRSRRPGDRRTAGAGGRARGNPAVD